MSEASDELAFEKPLPTAMRRAKGRLEVLYQRFVAPYEIGWVIAASLLILLPGIWAYSLIDPWETHYGEVARRMLQDNDWVHLRWQNESFRSKPVLTFWLIAGSLKTLGVAGTGGYSGELVDSGFAIFAVRLPFVLFAVLGLAMTWNMLARLVNPRIAWLSLLVLATTPFFFMVARQAITDMPMVATLMGAVSSFALAIHAGDEPVRPFWKRISALHVVVAVAALLVLSQCFYILGYLGRFRETLAARWNFLVFALLFLWLVGSMFSRARLVAWARRMAIAGRERGKRGKVATLALRTPREFLYGACVALDQLLCLFITDRVLEHARAHTNYIRDKYGWRNRHRALAEVYLGLVTALHPGLNSSDQRLETPTHTRAAPRHRPHRTHRHSLASSHVSKRRPRLVQRVLQSPYVQPLWARRAR
jgi:hypothetical protein